MQSSLIRTKLFRPQSIDGLDRLRLEHKLNRVLVSKLVIVHAPAGYGKTSLVSHWLKKKEQPHAWLSLDASDNDPRQFLQYLTAALSAFSPNLASLQDVASLALPLHEHLTRMINSLTELSHDVVLVLDDYHLIKTDEIDQLLVFFLEHLPPKLHLIITSRSMPTFPLAKLRVRRQVHDISADDLRFTIEESQAFLNTVMDLNLSLPEVKRLAKHTEGWIASMQLLALSMQADDKAKIMNAFQGSDKLIFEYLAEEVFKQQPAEVQQFLLETSILERFNLSVCQALTNLDQSAEILRHIKHAQLFLISLDDQGIWYRYHHLFSAFLQAQLSQMRPEKIPDLHIKASVWFDQEGHTNEAIRHVLAGGEIERATELVEAHSHAVFWKSDDKPMLRQWLSALPDEVIRARPRLSLDSAWLALGSPKTEERLIDAERSLGEREDPEASLLRAEIDLLRAECAIIQGDTQAAYRHLEAGLERLPKDKAYLRGQAMQTKGYVLRVAGQAKEAESILQEAIDLCKASGNLVSEIFAHSDLAEVYKLQGRLTEAKRVFEQTLALASEGRSTPSLTASGAFIGLASIHYEQNELQAAWEASEKGLELAKTFGFSGIMVYGYLMAVRILHAQNDSEASSYLNKAVGLVGASESGWRRSQIEAECALADLKEGKLAAAVRWAEAQAKVPKAEIGQREREQLTLIRIRMAQGQCEDALKQLEAMLGHARSATRLGRVIEMLILKASNLYKLNREKEALEAFSEALKLAEAENYIRIFVNEGSVVRRLLQATLAQKIRPAYVSRLLRNFPVSKQVQSLLTKREQQILLLIAEGLSNEAIAEKLIRSTGTVKTHTSNIYSKLGVASRTEAVARARELELL